MTTAALTTYLPWLQRHGQIYQNDADELHITVPERVPHVLRDDTVVHICKADERLQDIAVYYYKNSIEAPVDCWEIIAQFQEDPIIDGSVPMEAGRVLLIPSLAYIQEVALGDPLYEYPQL
jgi:hypothetical protein